MAQRALQHAVCVQTGLIASALCRTGHRPVLPSGVDIPGVNAHFLSCCNGTIHIAAAAHIQPPFIGNAIFAVLHPGLDAAGTQSTGAVVPGNGEVVGLLSLDVLQELFEAGNAGTGLGVEDIAVEAIVLGNFNQLISCNVIAVCVFSSISVTN